MEVQLKVTLQLDYDDPHPEIKLALAAKQAVTNALQFAYDNGFVHDLAGDVSIGIIEVEGGDCIKDDPKNYLEYLSGNESACLTLDIDLTQHGYKEHSGDYESGLHPGQTDNPHVIAKQLRQEGINDFIFVLDQSSQFYITFSVWIKDPDVDEEN